MSTTEKDADIRELLSRAGTGITVPPAPVASLIVRRNRQRRARRAQATAALAVAAAVALPLSGVLPSWNNAKSSIAVAGRGENQLGTIQIKAPRGWKTTTKGDCARPNTLVLLEGSTGLTACGEGPSIVRSNKKSKAWPTGEFEHHRAGLTLLHGAPVWLDEPATGDPGTTVLSVPYAAGLVEIHGTEKQRTALLNQITVTPPPAPAVLQTTRPATAAVLTTPGKPPVTNTRPDDVRALTKALSAAEPAPQNDCVPATSDQIVIHIAPNTGSDPDDIAATELTSLVTATRGNCQLTYSSTGAVVRTDPALRAAITALQTP